MKRRGESRERRNRARRSPRITEGRHSDQVPIAYHRLDLSGRTFGRAAIVDDGVRQLPLGFGGHLHGLAIREILFRPAALRLDACQANRARGVHIDEFIADVIPTGLEHDGRVEDDEFYSTVAVRSLDFLANSPFDVRVDQMFQPTPFDGTRKNDAAELLSIDAAALVQNPPTPPNVLNSRQNLRPFQCLVPERIASNESAAMAQQGRGDRALARADAADEANHGFATRKCGIHGWLPLFGAIGVDAEFSNDVISSFEFGCLFGEKSVFFAQRNILFGEQEIFFRK